MAIDLAEINFLRAVGLRLRERRAALGLTQAQLAEKCRLHRTFIGSVERGERNLSLLNLRTIAQALRLPLDELFAPGSPAPRHRPGRP